MKNFAAASGILVLTALFVSGCSSSAKTPHPPAHAAAPMSAADSQLTAIIQTFADAEKRVDAYSAPYFDVEEDLGKFGDYPAPEFYERSKKINEAAVANLQQVDPAALSPSMHLTYRLFKDDMEVSLKSYEFPNRYLDVNQMGSRLHDFMDSSSQSLTSFPFDSVKHYKDYLSRAQGFPLYVDRQIALMREGIKKNIVLSCTVAGKVPNTYTDALIKDPKKNPFYRPVDFMPKTFSASERQELADAFATTVTKTIVPAYEKFDHFYRHEYLKRCRQGFGLTSLPGAKEWYAQSIKESTNLDLSPATIHETGLREVARISSELKKLQNQKGFKGSLRAFMRSVANDPSNYFATAPEMFAAFEKVKVATAKKIPDYFSLIPKSDFKIVESSNPNDPAGEYNMPTDTIPYGRFITNTKNLHAVAKSGVSTLLLHETVPGHHFQLALQYEMKDHLSYYQRKMYNSNAFVEGWALYSEYLGNEMGLYSDPAQRFGNLNDEMLRAVRLVVDTGIHAMGWSQKKAMSYAMNYLSDDTKAIEIEINRYSVWPGQALGYKIGQMKILELRHRAEAELGSRFDIKGFHAAVIGNGTVSLSVLETQVTDWIASIKNSPLANR